MSSLRSTILLLVIVTIGVVAAPLHAATIVIINGDGPGEGFNDPTAAAPVGGNPGVTRGQQRLNAFQYAADLWGAVLQSNVTITVQASMDPLFCSQTQAVLGSAGTFTVLGNFPNAPVLNTWYPQAVANSLAGVDLHANPDIGAQFNSNLNGAPQCLGGNGWYYGYDQNPPAGDIDFVAVVVHEIGHGLGFATYVNLGTGAKLGGFDDTYMLNLERHGASPADYPSMTDAQRVAASTSDPNLHFLGNCTLTYALANWVNGVSNGHPRMHGPNPAQSGSSVSHFAPAASPNELMEPFYTGPNHELGAALQLMKDIGWNLIPAVNNTAASATVSFPPGLWEVRIELDNLGLEDAVNVSAQMMQAAAWQSFPDDNCGYSTIASGGSSFGDGGDSYTIDLGLWPGGSFDVQLFVTWTDDCGTPYSKTVTQNLTPPNPTGIKGGPRPPGAARCAAALRGPRLRGVGGGLRVRRRRVARAARRARADHLSDRPRGRGARREALRRVGSRGAGRRDRRARRALLRAPGDPARPLRRRGRRGAPVGAAQPA